LGYILLPLVLSLPFYFSIYNLTFLNSIFESVSGFTSTGFTIFDNIKHIDPGFDIMEIFNSMDWWFVFFIFYNFFD
jgi:trk system potassium uptake protein TrkH